MSMTNLSLIDRPKTIATLEYFDITICVVIAALITLPLMLLSVLFMSAHPLVAVGVGVWIRERKKGKAFGYSQRWIYKKYHRFISGKRVIYAKTA
jgi:hypothetical protein